MQDNSASFSFQSFPRRIHAVEELVVSKIPSVNFAVFASKSKRMVRQKEILGISQSRQSKLRGKNNMQGPKEVINRLQ